MQLQKTPININFAKGMDQKSDPKQIPIGKFADLQNSIFTKQGLLKKRNGFAQLTSLPNALSTFATTFNGNLTAIGVNLYAYSSGSQTWVQKGALQPATLETVPLIRSNTNQSQADAAVASNGLVCTVFTDNIPSGGSTVASYKYVVADSETGQNIVAPTVITASSGTIAGSPRVFCLGNYFVIVFSNNVSGTYHLQYIAVNSTIPTLVTAAVDISTQYTPATTVAWDGVVANNSLYLAWNGSDGGGAIRMTYIDSTLTQHNTVSFASRTASIMSVCADNTGATPVIYAAFYDVSGTTGYVLAVTSILTTVLSPTQWVSSGTILNVTCAAQSGTATIFYELSNAYSYDSGVKTNIVKKRTCTSAGSLGTATNVLRSVGLASKAFIIGTTAYFLSVYSSSNQPTYFLSDSSGNVIAKLAYQNASGYYTLGLPSVTISNTTASFAYFFKDLIIPVNKDNGAATSSGIYTQLGINLAKVTIGTSDISTAELGSDLHLSGGIMYMYDGYYPVEHGFLLWPDNVEVTGSTSGGTMTAQQYYYVATYEWSDNQGNIHRSAPSIPVTVTTTGSTSSVTVNVPTLRITYKTANPVKIVVYRWSTAQQTFYQATSLSVPTLNDTTTDSVAFVDTLPDSSIIGNSILYTTGGVIENIAAPAVKSLTIFKSRLLYLTSENSDLLGYSKQVVQGEPVETNDVFTIFVPPTTSSQTTTGPCRFVTAMDDKALIFKDEAIAYFVGTGPDNTGANNDFSEPVFINSPVGSRNQQSVVTIPQGLMFQSNGKGIWLLGRDLQVSYIGAPVEDYNSFTVTSAVDVPGTNQVRFTLSNGKMLMYDYFFGEWGTFVGVEAVSSTAFDGLHTVINSRGEVYQENPGSYLDGANPVLMRFTTGPINVAGLQGYQRAYGFFFVGDYFSPHKLNILVSYDYAAAPTQSSVVTPENFNAVYGDDPLYGSYEYGGELPLEQWQVFFQRQRCQSFQITVQEYFDSSLGVAAGEGLNLSGLNLVVGVLGTQPKIKQTLTVG